MQRSFPICNGAFLYATDLSYICVVPQATKMYRIQRKCTKCTICNEFVLHTNTKCTASKCTTCIDASYSKATLLAEVLRTYNKSTSNLCTMKALRICVLRVLRVCVLRVLRICVLRATKMCYMQIQKILFPNVLCVFSRYVVYYGVATVIRIDKIIGFSCKRAL